jgi:Na+-translocating ferredoxin:NAD+ oxidoreductase RNF subunit RnfB
METITAIGFLLSLASALGVVLAIANARLKVFEDPRIDEVDEMLPGNNCGACGLPGCRAFAEKAVSGDVQPSDCPVGGAETAESIAEFLGVDAGDTEKKVARLLCAGGTNVAIQMAEYAGYPSCRAAAAVAGGGKGCRYGCLGFGDCMSVCTFDAIKMSPTGLPIISLEKCTSCGDCVDICPKHIIEIMPVSQKLVVQCKSLLEGDEVLELCAVGCTACGKCAADAPAGLMKMKQNLPVLNMELLHLQTPTATSRCESGSIVWIEDQQFEGVNWDDGKRRTTPAPVN